MTRIRNDRTSRQRRRAGAMLVLAAATGGLLAAAMAGLPTARADDPFTDISNDVQNSITIGEADYTAAATDFSTPGDTNAGLAAEFVGFDNTFISSSDYTLLGLVAAGTGTDYSGDGSIFDFPLSILPDTAAAAQADATAYFADATSYFTDAASFLSSGEYFDAAAYGLLGSYADILGGQADTLAGLFSLGF